MKLKKVLAVFANPKGSIPLRLGTEDRVIRECLMRSKYRENLNLDVRHAATIHDVRRALLEDDYQIVHFSGHGTGQGLAFENESGQTQLVPEEALAELLCAYSPPIEAVLLNACYSDTQGKLISLGVPYTIGMNAPISDDGSIEFTRGFYDAIGAGKDFDFAYQEGCRAIKLSGLPDGATPVFLKNIEGVPRLEHLTSMPNIQQDGVEQIRTVSPKIGITVSAVEYFCYISESKVNQLYSQISDIVEFTPENQDIKRIVEIRKELALGQAKANEAELIEELRIIESRRNLMSMRFGGRAESKSTRKLAGLESLDDLLVKFRSVLHYLVSQKRVLDLENVLENKSRLDGFCYYYSGLFHFQEFASPEMAIISSRCHDYDLRLYCSMKYFSDMAYFQDKKGNWHAEPHSANFAFFHQSVKPKYGFKALVFLTSVQEMRLLGSPLCLILDSHEGVAL